MSSGFTQSDSSSTTIQVPLSPSPFPASWDVFCVNMAMGMTARDAAVNAGYSAVYGDTLGMKAEIREKVNSLVLARMADGGVASKLWAELRLYQIAEASWNGVPDRLDEATGQVIPGMPKNPDRAITAIMAVGKIKGWIIDRKQTLQGKIDLNAASELPDLLEATLGELSAEDKNRIKELSAVRRKRKSSVPSARNSQTIVDVPSSSAE